MSKILDRNALTKILVGSTFLGSGGGGSSEQGLYLIKRIECQTGDVKVQMVDINEIEKQKYVVMVAGIGAPKVMKERGFGPEALHAFDAIKGLCTLGGRNVEYLMPGEMGGFNTLVPIYVAALKGLPIVDADGNGRAVPELSTTLYRCNDIPVSPLVLANSTGDVSVFYLRDPSNYHQAEELARTVTTTWGMSAAFATWVISKEQIKHLVPGSISFAEQIGDTFLNSRTPNELSEKLQNFGILELFAGRIATLGTVSQGGFDIGVTVVEGIQKYRGSRMEIYFKNENILAKIDGSIKAMVPDIISLVSVKQLKPITNADTVEGQEIIIYWLKSHERWYENKRGFECWKHILEAIGYSGQYVEFRH